jgi:glycerate 2-kinase
MHESVAMSPLYLAHPVSPARRGPSEAAAPRPPAHGWNDEPSGLAERMAARHGGRLCNVQVTGPFGEPQRTCYAFIEAGDDSAPGVPLAVIETSAAAGRSLAAPGWQRPLAAGSYGVGELIRAALNHGARRIVLDCDDSAGIDGGAGMLQALGARLLDRRGGPIGHGAAELARLARLDPSRLDLRLARVRLQAAVDWSLCLLGDAGVVETNGQHFDGDEAQWLQAAFERYALALFDATGVEVAALPGGGAACGIGAAAAALLGARLVPRDVWTGTRRALPPTLL